MATEENIALRQRYELLKGAENHKNHLIEELLRRVDELTEDYHQERLDHDREKHFNRDVQQKDIRLQNELQKYKALMDRDAFILVLIDGDGMIFEDDLIAKGEAGGREAAGYLWNSVTDFVQQSMAKSLPSDYKIVTRVYANLKGLGDVGMGKDRADDKISEVFKLHLYDTHCRQILLGCSHDNGYARLLEDVGDPTICNSITLLEGVPFEKELFQLKSKYQTTKFEGLFRSKKINVYQQNHSKPPMQAPQVQHTNGLPPPSVQYPPPVQHQLPPQLAQYQSPYQPTISRATSSSSPSNGALLNPTAPTWATTAMAAPLQFASPPPTPQPTPKAIKEVSRNRLGQRIDPVVQYDPQEVKRIKKMKMCNVHYLRNDCPYDPCTHDHHYKPNKNELATLRYVSRMTPCKFGSECDDLKCIYGHRCPNDVEGKTDCRWGENCRFEKELHGIDRIVVKTTKVGKS